MVLTGWHLAHVVILGLWGGVVLAEAVMEIGAHRHRHLRDSVVRLHYLIDVFVEVPLLAGVVITGAVLLMRAPAIDAFLWAKVLCGVGAVALNAGCVFAVIRRCRMVEEKGDTSLLTRLVFGSAGLGVPLAAVALYLGGQRGGWW
jgi:hypothetical protein